MEQKSQSISKELLELMNVWYYDAREFVKDVFPDELENFDDWQWDALWAISTDNRVAIRSGHGVGKTAFLAVVIIWFMITRGECKIPCTAPSGHQLEDILWPEISKWIKKLPDRFQKLFNHKTKHVEMIENPRLAFAVARTARKEKPEALQGFHAENLLFILDEGSGIEEIIFETAQGALSTPGAKIVITGNPTRTTGYFFDCFNKMKNLWTTFKVGCADSIHSTQLYIDEIIQKYGIDSNVYRVRVLGEFPRDDDDSVIRLSTVESAVGRQVENSGGDIIWGVDVARFGGDKSSLAKRQGNTLLAKVRTWQNKDTMQTAGLIKLEWDDAPDYLKPKSINVDVIGLGAGVVDRLKEMGLPVNGVNVSEAPSVKEQYARQRDELWFEGREWFESLAVSIVDDEDLIGELTTPKYKVISTGKKQVESKDDLKKRSIASPDRADAFLLTFANAGKRNRNFYGELPVAEFERAVV